MTSNFLFGVSVGLLLLQRNWLYQDHRGPGSNPDKPEFFQAFFLQLLKLHVISSTVMIFFIFQGLYG